MIKPLWAVAGIALFGSAGVAGALVVAPLGGEEEVVSQIQETGRPTATASTEPDPEGWLRYRHPGTPEAPPFSFAYPGDWYLQEPELIAVTLPKGEPLGTGVQVELSSWDRGASPSYPPPPEAVSLEVFVGPYATLTICGPTDAGDSVDLGGASARRIVSAGNPPGTTRTIIVYAITDTDCYALTVQFSQSVPDEDTFKRIVDSFRVGENVPTSTPPVAPSTTASSAAGSPTVSPATGPEGFATYIHQGSKAAPAFSFVYPADWFLTGGGEPPEGAFGFGIVLTPWDPKTAPGRGGIPSNSMKVDMGVVPIALGGEGNCPPENSEPAVLGGEAGWGSQNLLDDGVAVRVVAADHAGFRYCIIGYLAEPPDPTIFDRIVESFRFQD